MKKFLLLLLVIISTSGYAKKVKFAVDMTGQLINPLGQHVSGDFQTLAGFPGGNWSSNTTPLTQEGITNIYSIVVDIPAFAKYEYKFVNGDMFYDAEFVPELSRVGYNFNDNRWIYVDSLANDTTFLGAILFGGNAPAGLTLLRTLVDMSNVTTIAATGVHLAGNFQGWNPATDYMYSFGAGVYEVISFVQTGNQEYKFYNGNTTADAEVVPAICSVNSSRNVQVAGDTILSVVCFAECTACVVGIEERISKQFTIYPNPASEYVTVQFTDNRKRAVFIHDVSGRLVLNYTADETNKVILPLHELKLGLYNIQVLSQGGIYTSEKLIIQ